MKHTRIIVTHHGGPDALRVLEGRLDNGSCPDPQQELPPYFVAQS